eukprot:UN02923
MKLEQLTFQQFFLATVSTNLKDATHSKVQKSPKLKVRILMMVR